MQITSHEHTNFDAIVVGGSIAGCVCALKLARKGAKVALIEKRSNPEHYKKICSHIIHPSGVETLADLDILDNMPDASTHHTYMEIASGSATVSFPFGRNPSAANIERRDIDPALKRAITANPNISGFFGYSVDSITKQGRRVTGIKCTDQIGNQHSLSAKLTIGADGRTSKMAQLIKAKPSNIDNGRAAIFSYFERGSCTEMIESKVWTNDRGQSYIGCFPNQNHVLITWYVPSSKLAEIQEDKEAYFSREVLGFLAEKDIEVGEQKEPLIVAKDTSTSSNQSAMKGTTLIGDALLAADPLTGVGCSWAMGSASMLSAIAAKPLTSKNFKWKEQLALDAAVMIYEILHRLRYSLPSKCMAVMSKHGEFVFTPAIFKLASKISHFSLSKV